MPKARWGRGIQELLVIVLGVLIALGADRWIESRDDRSRADGYEAQLMRDIHLDVVELRSRIEVAGVRAQHARVFLEMANGTRAIEGDLAELVLGFEYVGRFTPFETTRHTWDDLVSTGNSELLDPELRAAVGEYQRAADALNDIGREFDEQLRIVEVEAWDVQPPLRRAALLDRSTTVDPPVGLSDLQRVVRAVRERPRLQVGLGQIRILWLDSGGLDQDLLTRAEALVDRFNR